MHYEHILMSTFYEHKSTYMHYNASIRLYTLTGASYGDFYSNHVYHRKPNALEQHRVNYRFYVKRLSHLPSTLCVYVCVCVLGLVCVW